MALIEEDGSFVLKGLPEGRVLLVVWPPDGEGNLALPRSSRGVRVPAEGVVETDLYLDAKESSAISTFNFTYYRGEYYNNQTTMESATPVPLVDRGTAAGIDMELSRGGGTISGRVTREADGEPIAGIIVSADYSTIESTGSSFDRTDENGFYRITALPAAPVMVSAGLLGPRPDYVGEAYDNIALGTGGTSTPIQVNEGTDTPDINFALAPGGSISGRVTSEASGLGVPNTVVRYADFGLGVGGAVRTDAGGDYSIRGLPAGSWIVFITTNIEYVREYWNNHMDLFQADSIHVVAAEQRTNIDFVLTPGAYIVGTVTHETTGEPVAGTIQASRNGDGSSRVAIVNEDGSFRISGLPSGSYRVRSFELGEWWNNQTSEETANLVTVTAGLTVDNIDFVGIPLAERCEPPFTGILRSVVVDETQQPVANAIVELYDAVSNELLREGLVTNRNGVCQYFCLEPGSRYFVKVKSRNTVWLTEWYDGTTQANADTVTILPNQVTAIDLMLERGGSIQGRITAPGGMPLSGASVIGYGPGSSFLYASADADGRYEMDFSTEGGLTGGDYVIQAVSYSTADPALVPVLLSRFVATATADGGVRLEWTTGHETGHAGFHVERIGTAGGPAQRITTTLLTGGPAYEYIDTAPPAGENRYWLVALSRDGRTERFGPFNVYSESPMAARFFGAAANPSRDTASIHWDLSRVGRVRLEIFDALGRRICTLVDEIRPPGAGEAIWNGTTDSGSPAAGGLYFLRFESPAGIESRRLTFMR